MKVLSVNVGNLKISNIGKISTIDKDLNLQRLDVENAIKNNLTKISPDIVCFQELRTEYTEHHVQAEKLLGASYYVYPSVTGNCAIGLRKSMFKSVKIFDAQHIGTPLFNKYSISTLEVEYEEVKFYIVNCHLPAINSKKRRLALNSIFDENGLTKRLNKYLIMGDFNFDLFSNLSSSGRHFSKLKNIEHNSDLIIHNSMKGNKAEPSHRVVGTYRTLDYMFSNFLKGNTKSLGYENRAELIDNGLELDHYALYAELDL